MVTPYVLVASLQPTLCPNLLPRRGPPTACLGLNLPMPILPSSYFRTEMDLFKELWIHPYSGTLYTCFVDGCFRTLSLSLL